MAGNCRLAPVDAEELQSQEKGLEAIRVLIEEASTIAICAHTSPDGDALGTQLGLAELIRINWPNKDVHVLLADPEPVPRIYEFLPGTSDLVFAGDYDEDPDLFIAVDLSSAPRLNVGEQVLKRARKAAIIDHHPCDDPFGEAWVIRPSAAAASVIVTEFAQQLGTTITPTMAQNLMCAIVTDTGRFQYQNADSEAFEAASLLVQQGANPSEISLNVYQSFRLQYLHLKSLVLGRIKTFEKGRIAYSYATQADLERTGAALDECDGLIDMVRSVEGAEVALFLKTVPGGKVRGNLRSKGRHDVAEVAKIAGGGGHRAAAGFTVEGDIDEALSKILPPLRALFADDGATA